ncbi:hypothetical protein PMAYCL1PPCAC_23097, partial [Pristionchus mayeri]
VLDLRLHHLDGWLGILRSGHHVRSSRNDVYTALVRIPERSTSLWRDRLKLASSDVTLVLEIDKVDEDGTRQQHRLYAGLDLGRD